MSNRHPRVARLVGAGAVALIAVSLVSGPAMAAKRPGGGSGSTSVLALVMSVDRDGNGSPNWNDQVTFTVTTTATSKPWVRLDCYQDAAWVSTATAGFFPDYPWAPVFTLASGAWTGGAGDCTATLYAVTSNGRQKTLATLGFHVDP